jgi:hypothetical protein
MSTHRPRLGSLLCAALVLLAAAPVDAALLNYEYGAAQARLGELRTLLERLNKQNLLYHLHLADQNKLDQIETARRVDEALDDLRRGDPLAGIPRPPTQEIREQLAQLEAAWVPLRSITLASPYDYLRRSREFGALQDRSRDPLLLRRFDRVASQLIDAVRGVMALYDEQCKQDGYTHCDVILRLGFGAMLSERLVKEAILVYTGIDPNVTAEQLAETRDRYEALRTRPQSLQVLEEATAPGRGSEGEYVMDLLRSIDETWERLRGELDLVIDGRAEKASLRRAVQLQDLLVVDIQHISVAVTRFVRVEQGGAGLPAAP